MQKLNRSWGFFIYCACVATVAIIILGRIVFTPSEPENALLLGLSAPRLLLALMLLVGVLFFMFLSIRAAGNPIWAREVLDQYFGQNRRSRGVAWLTGISFAVGWIGCFLPFYRAGILGVHWERIRPAMIFILVASTATLLVILLRRSNFNVRDLRIRNLYKLSLIWVVLTLLIVQVMFLTGFGVSAAEDYWYGAGVPILITQLIVAIIGGVFFLWLENNWAIKRWDLVIVFLLYGITAILWAREPLERSFLFIGPYAPNRVLYPFADAAIFDTASQFALIGQNFFIFNGQFFERAVYISFLTYLHSIVGQEYTQMMAAQAVVFAIFPTLMYLIGKSWNARAIGFAAALVAMFRGANSIAASNMIDMANPKMMLTDFPTAIGLALVVLFLSVWLKSPRQKWPYALWIGGIVGLTIMLRTNALLILLLIPLYTFLYFMHERKTWIATSFLLLLAVFAITLPWELRNQSLGGKMYDAIFAKFENVFLRRYTPPPSDSLIPQDPRVSFASFQYLYAVNTLYSKADLHQVGQVCNEVTCFVPNHFLHNVLTSVLILPTSFSFDDLRHTVKESYPYWQPKWDGSFTGISSFFFVANIFLIVLGIVAAWKQHHLTGLMPLAVFVFYNVSNGFARTSGGRYIVPIDWIIAFYFLIGVFQTILLFANALGAHWTLFQESAPHTFRKTSFRKDAARVITILGILFAVGALVPLAEHLYPTRYQGFDISKVLLDRQTQINDAGLSLSEIDAFLQNPNAEVSVGRALYPRYYIENEGEVHFYPVVVMGFPRTTFTLIGPAGEKGIVLPGEKPDYFPHAVDTIVLGCKEQNYVDALAVILLDETGGVYTRSPESPLQCPLKQPVCDNNHNCY